jgi:hypothetical protein
MKFLISIVSLVLLFTSYASPQYMDLCWPLGYDSVPRANFNFSSGNLVIDTVLRNMKLFWSNACISDSTGNILALTNGCFITNIIGDTMDNGAGLNPGPCTSSTCSTGGIVIEGDLILPVNQNQFCLIHETCNSSTQGNPTELFSSTIDLSLDSGRGSVINKNTVLLADSFCFGDLSAVKHANGVDWWIMVNRRFTNKHITFLFSASGLLGPYSQYYGNVFDSVGWGNSKFSPDGFWYATSTNCNSLFLYSFNRCNGTLSNFQNIQNPDSLTSFIEFSASSRFLYLITASNIYQYDLTSSNINNSRLLIATYDGYTNTMGFGAQFWLPQLAPDHKIYIAARNSQTIMHVINSPNSLGMSADVQQHSIQLPCSNSGTIPSLPNYHLGALDPNICDSLNTISDIFPYNPMVIFPNPSHELLHLKFNRVNHSGLNKIYIYNVLGELVINRDMYLNSNSDEVSCDISELAPSIYYIIVSDGIKTYKKSFCKM